MRCVLDDTRKASCIANHYQEVTYCIPGFVLHLRFLSDKIFNGDFMEFIDILKELMVPNRDDGNVFKDTERIEKINTLLWNSKYKRANVSGLFALYSIKPVECIENPVLISSHIDCVTQITDFFVKDFNEELLLGTFDNCITNAVVTYLMLNKKLDDNVIVAFTGDEECDSNGASRVVEYLTRKNKVPKATIVLDVTDMGWNSSFTIENNFWSEAIGKRIINTVESIESSWKFVPSDLLDIPDYVGKEFLIREEAEEDESWMYDEYSWECFSFCLPTKGPMHSNLGVYARKEGVFEYIEALEKVVNDIVRYE